VATSNFPWLALADDAAASNSPWHELIVGARLDARRARAADRIEARLLALKVVRGKFLELRLTASVAIETRQGASTSGEQATRTG
jgi:hypothetical protein